MMVHFANGGEDVRDPKGNHGARAQPLLAPIGRFIALIAALWRLLERAILRAE